MRSINWRARIALLVLLGALGWIACDAWARWSQQRHDAYCVLDARLDPLDDGVVAQGDGKKAPPVYLRAHHILHGDGMVCSLREFSGGHPRRVDDERYNKLSVEFPRSAVMATASAWRQTEVVARQTLGSSAWLRVHCGGVLNPVRIKLQRHAHGYRLLIDGQWVSSGAEQSHCANAVERSLVLDFDAVLLDRSQLTPWLGQPSADGYEQTYPRTGSVDP